MCAGAPAASELSAYERERLSNIQRNNEVLEKMGLAPGGGLVPAIRKSAPAKAKRKPVHVEAEPQRRSGRIRKALAPDVYVDDEVDEERTKRRGLSKRAGLSSGVTVGGADAASLIAEAAAEAESDPEAVMLPTEPEHLSDLEREVYEIIREARNAKARSMARSMFIVCGNRTMVEMCRLVPSTPEELLGLHGMGELKVQRYGELLLNALRPHADRLHAEHQAKSAEARTTGNGSGTAAE